MEKALTVNRWALVLAFVAAALTAAAIWAGMSLAGGPSGGAPAGNDGGGAPPVLVQDESQAETPDHDGRDCPFKDRAGSSSSPSTSL